MSTSTIAFARGPLDSGDPSAAIFRPQSDGTFETTAVNGSDETANFAIFLLKDMLETMPLDVVVPALRSMYTDVTGNDIEDKRAEFLSALNK